MILASSKEKNATLSTSDFRKARVAAIVAGRMKSTRLANKAILPIAGIPSIERCLEQCTGIKGVDQVILATSDLESDSALTAYTLGGRAQLWRGHPDDVIKRYVDACDHFDIDVVVRVTADCPLVLPEIIEYLLDKHFEAGADYTAAKEFAVGTSGEIINTSALRRVANHFGQAMYSEYMTWYFQNNPDHFKLNIVSLPDEYIRDYRLTLDYPEDLEMFESLFSNLPRKDGVQCAREVFLVLDGSPDIVKLNAHLTLKYKTDKELIALLNEKTRMSQMGKSEG